MITIKKCNKCGKLKNKKYFRKCKRNKDNLQFWCKECSNEYMKLWKIKNKEKFLEWRRKYDRKYSKTEKYKKQKNIYSKTEKRREYLKRWLNKRRNENPKIHLDTNMGNAIYQVLRSKKDGQSWEKLVGYTLKDLIKHLESQFECWMNWANYGKWHIDHIRPISSFHYEIPEDPEFQECWALKNLQPMEAIANIKKGSRY